MSFWSVLERVGESVGVLEVEDASSTPAPTPTAASAPVIGQSASVRPPAAVAPADVNRIAELDKTSRDRLIQAMQGAGANAVTDLGDMLDTLRDAIPDERTLYSKALNVLAKKGITTVQVVGDYDKCIGVLEENAREFEANCKSQKESRIGTRLKAIETYNATIAAKQQQLLQLQQEISDLQQKSNTDQASIAGEQAKIDQVQERFTLAYRAIRSEVEAQRTKVSTYGVAS